MSSEYSGTEAPDSIGTVIGYRSFRLDIVRMLTGSWSWSEDYLSSSEYDRIVLKPILKSIVINGFKWNPGPNVAKCNSGCVKIPSLGHGCGFYALYNAHMIPFFAESYFKAAIEVHGRLILGTKGFRASNAKILGLVPDQTAMWRGVLYYKLDTNELIQSVQQAYGVPIFKSREDLIAAFPPTDMSAYDIKEKPPMMRQLIANGIIEKDKILKVNWNS